MLCLNPCSPMTQSWMPLEERADVPGGRQVLPHDQPAPGEAMGTPGAPQCLGRAHVSTSQPCEPRGR